MVTHICFICHKVNTQTCPEHTCRSPVFLAQSNFTWEIYRSWGPCNPRPQPPQTGPEDATVTSTCSDPSIMSPLMPGRQFVQRLRNGVSPSALLNLRRGCFCSKHIHLHMTLCGENSSQLVSWVCGINSRQSPHWVMMGRLGARWHGASLIGRASTWRQEAGNKAGLEL